jgi:hypothetical protein
MDSLAQFMMAAFPVQAGARAKAHMVSHPSEQGRDAKRAKTVVDLVTDVTPVIDLEAGSADAGGASSSSQAHADWDRRELAEELHFGDWMAAGMAADAADDHDFEDLFESLNEADAGAQESANAKAPPAQEPCAEAKAPSQDSTDAKELPAQMPQQVQEPAAKTPPAKKIEAEAKKADAKEADPKKTEAEAKKAIAKKTKAPEAKKPNASAESAAGVPDVFAKYLRLNALMRAKPELFECAMPEEIATWGEWYAANKIILSDLPRSAHPKPLYLRGFKSYTLMMSAAKITIRLDSAIIYIKPAKPWCEQWGFHLDKSGGISLAWRKHGAAMAWMLARLFAGELDGLGPQYPSPIR